DEVAHGRHGGTGHRAHELLDDGDLTPPGDAQTLLRGDALNRGGRSGALDGRAVAAGEEGHADGVVAGLGERERELGAEEGVGDLEEDPGAVAGVLLRADGSAVVEVLQRGETGLDDVAGRGAAERG